MARRGFTGVMMRGYGAQDREAVVTGTEWIAPHFRRVRFRSPELLADVVVAPTAWVRFWFPDPGEPAVEHQRAYTLSEVDPEAGTFAVDMLLHEPAGPASAWAQEVAAGDTIQVTTLGSSRFDLPEELPAGYLLIGDAASLPAINAILGVVPAEVPIELYLEDHSDEDRLIPLAHHPRLAVHRVARRDEASLAAALQARDWSDWYAWTAPESGSLKHLRTRLRDDFGFPRSEIHAQAYWFEGRAFGKRRSRAEEREAAAAAAATVAGVAASAGAAPSGSGPTPEVTPAGTPASPPGRAQDPAPVSASTQAPASTKAPAAGPAPGPAAPAEAAPDQAPSGRWRSQAAGRLLAPLRRTLWTAGVLQAVLTLLQLAPYVLLVELARRLLTGSDAAALWTIGAWMLAVLLGGVLLQSALLTWLHLVDAGFSKDLRGRLLAKLGRLPLGWFDARGSGGVKQLVQDDTLALHYLVTHAVPDAVGAVVAPVAVLAYLFVVDWRIALVLLLPVLVYLVATTIMLVRSGPRTGQAMRWAERMNSEAAAYLEGQPVVRVFGGAAASTFRRRLGEYVDFLHAWQRPMSGQKVFIDLATRPATFLLLIAATGTALVTAGRAEPVTLVPFLLLGTTFGARLLGIGYGLSGLRTGMLAARRIQVALDEPELAAPPALAVSASPASGGTAPDGTAPGVAAPGGTAPVVLASDGIAPHGTAPGGTAPDGTGVPEGLVELRDVGFAYRPGVSVLDRVSLSLRPGTVTALVGPSGSGKSTLAALIARFHDVDEGAILVGGTDVRALTQDELYARVGFVLQQPRLVRGTVRENIALAVPEATDAQVRAAARAARIDERIQRLPDGYDTVLGPDPALSGGERQRLTIARAILADPAVLVLDEATAFADPESEYHVQRALDRLMAGRTVLVVAHRLHTVTGVDRIVVLDGGRVVEEGRHEELLARRGRYRDLWDAGGHDPAPPAPALHAPVPAPSTPAPAASAPSVSAPSAAASRPAETPGVTR